MAPDAAHHSCTYQCWTASSSPSHSKQRRPGKLQTLAHCLPQLLLLPALFLILVSSTAPSVQALGVNTAACPGLTNLLSVDQSPTGPTEYGKCTSAIQADQLETYTCQRPSLNPYPGPPPLPAQKCFKFGRMTVSPGPISGGGVPSTTTCNARIIGSNKHAFVGISTRYLNGQQSAWEADAGACGQCLCIRLAGVDTAGQQDAAAIRRQQQLALPYIGLVFAGMVGDRCYSCEDDHIEVLLDRPFAFAAYDPTQVQDDGTPQNPGAVEVNALAGLRGFGDPGSMIETMTTSPMAFQPFIADWQFVTCSTSHLQCAQLFNGLGYEGAAMLPLLTRGYNSNTLVANNATAEDPNSIIAALGGYATLSTTDVTEILKLPLPSETTLACTSSGGSSSSTGSGGNSTATNSTTSSGNGTASSNSTASPKTNATTTTSSSSSASSCTLTAMGSAILKPAPTIVGVSLYNRTASTDTSSGSTDTLIGSSTTNLLSRSSSGSGASQPKASQAASASDSSPNLLIPAGAIAGIVIGGVIIAVAAAVVTNSIVHKSRVKNKAPAGSADSGADGTRAAASTEGAAGEGNLQHDTAALAGLKVKAAASTEAAGVAAAAELIKSRHASGDGGYSEEQADHHWAAQAHQPPFEVVAAAAGFFLPMSSSASYGRSLSDSGVHRAAAQPGRARALAAQDRGSSRAGRGSSGGGAAQHQQPHVKDS